MAEESVSYMSYGEMLLRMAAQQAMIRDLVRDTDGVLRERETVVDGSSYTRAAPTGAEVMAEWDRAAATLTDAYAQRRAEWNRAWAAFYGQLTPEQRQTWYRQGVIDVRVPSGEWYRFVYMTSGNIVRHSDMQRFCLASARSNTYLPMTFACQLYLLLHGEALFLQLANKIGSPDGGFPGPSHCSCHTCRSEWPIPPPEL